MRPFDLAKRLKDEEDGSMLPLVIFYGFLSLVLVLLVVAATSLYLERKRLFTIADGAALVGAEAFDLDEISLDGGSPRPTLDSTDVATAVNDYLDTAPLGDFESLSVERAETADGRSATVALSAYWRPPVLSLLVPEGFRLEVTAVGRSVFS
ncbi:pilus assembly protein TadG-related protein [Glaciihabitans sp. UYNi722]|uniref:pilus assembly protein TadG-related protein n=1 Tax=Glaciihabitans sp. UYNi722 TaxID=3156344 RepID=UPI00339B1277